MKPLDSIEIKLCQAQAKIFEASIDKVQCSSPIFIRRFMNSSVAKSMDGKLYLFTSQTSDDAFDALDEEFGESCYGKEKYDADQMFWIGYIYRCLVIRYGLPSKYVFRLIKGTQIIKYYNICHTFDPVDACERIMDGIGYDDSSVEEKAYKAMRRLLYTYEKEGTSQKGLRQK